MPAPRQPSVVAPTRLRLLDAAVTVLGERGARALTVRAVEDAAAVPHGSVRHHFGDRRGLLGALADHIAAVEASRPTSSEESPPPERPVPVDPAAALADTIERWLGPGRTVALARYELFVLAARDPEIRAPLVRARESFVASAASFVGAGRARTVVAALDGLVLDALIRGEHDRSALERAVRDVLRAD